MTTHLPIGIFDSGIGGLTVANAVAQRLPLQPILYFGDAGRAPYGLKPAHLIRDYAHQISRFLFDHHCPLIIVACNTASAAALNALRQTWPEASFVGMEPAVKPAAAATRAGKVGVLATRGTFQSERYEQLLERYGRHIEVFEDPCIGLVELIESGAAEAPATEALLRRVLDPMLAKGVDTLVLGCTHYPFAAPIIRRIAGPKVAVIDPAPAVARQAARVRAQLAQSPPELAGSVRHRFVATGNYDKMQSAVDHFFGPGYPVEPATLPV